MQRRPDFTPDVIQQARLTVKAAIVELEDIAKGCEECAEDADQAAEFNTFAKAEARA